MTLHRFLSDAIDNLGLSWLAEAIIIFSPGPIENLSELLLFIFIQGLKYKQSWV